MVCHDTLSQVMELTPEGQDTLDQGKDTAWVEAQQEEATTSQSQTDVNIWEKIGLLTTSIEAIESCFDEIIDGLGEGKDIANVSECLTKDMDKLIAKWVNLQAVSGPEP